MKSQKFGMCILNYAFLETLLPKVMRRPAVLFAEICCYFNYCDDHNINHKYRSNIDNDC